MFSLSLSLSLFLFSIFYFTFSVILFYFLMSTLLCKVKANYAFESNDPSSLHFKEGDIIEVLCKLPSGWWDGW